MGRTRTRTRKARPPALDAVEAQEEKKSQPSVSALLEKAQELIVQCDYELAGKFAQRILQREPRHAEAKELLGVTQLETGELEAAKQTFSSLIPPSATAPSPPPPAAYLYLAQLSDDPQIALQHYRTAVDLLTVQLKGKERAVNFPSEDDEQETKRTIVRALIGQVEVWMDPAYDLCFDPAAESTCEELLQAALKVDPDNTEALQSLASVRMSQSRPDEAKEILEKAWTSWKDLDTDDPKLPPIPSRLALTKLFLELELYTPALLVLQGIMAADDEEVEAWYLEGWCFYLMAEQAHESGGKMDSFSWEELARDARDCLETCKTLHINQAHPDAPLRDHVKELIGKLEEMGIKPSPEDEDREDEEGWEDMDGSEESDGDIDMS
ncbi:TPR-like protein [Auriscalpium vulgare]|uniref:TPR-like protein n=1 Tax=Auriscalpium vulgare TaxID=40419 RepID=A0ACB8S1X7_9AGAM|nr:TPR-like protein [Auriscalpium vulgare]